MKDAENLIYLENLKEYFRSKNLDVVNLKLVSEKEDFLSPTPELFLTRTYCCELKNSVSKKIYIKTFSQALWESMPEIKEIKKFNKFKEELKIANIYDLVPKVNALLIEKVEGRKLSSLFPIYLLPFLRKKHEVIKKIIREVACSTAFLHNLTKRGEESLKHFCRSTHIELVKKEAKDQYEKLRKLVKDLETRKATVTRIYADLKLDNIFYCDECIKIVDFTLRYSFFFLDPLKFSLNLELLRLYPHIKKSIIERFCRIFYREYLRRLNWEIEENFLERLGVIVICRNFIRAKRESMRIFFKKILFKFYLNTFKTLLNEKLEKV